MVAELDEYLQETIALLASTRERKQEDRVDQAVGIIASALKSHRPLLVCGNGGSAADAMHIAGELVGRFLIERSGLRTSHSVAREYICLYIISVSASRNSAPPWAAIEA